MILRRNGFNKKPLCELWREYSLIYFFCCLWNIRLLSHRGKTIPVGAYSSLFVSFPLTMPAFRSDLYSVSAVRQCKVKLNLTAFFIPGQLLFLFSFFVLICPSTDSLCHLEPFCWSPSPLIKHCLIPARMPTARKLSALSLLAQNSSLTSFLFSPVAGNLPHLTPIMWKNPADKFFSGPKKNFTFFYFSRRENNIICLTLSCPGLPGGFCRYV